jgi:hypothetical protein
MMAYLDRLKGVDSEKCLPTPLQKPQKVPSCSFCCTHEARSQETLPEPGGPCRWWLLHYPDRELVEVACFPPATHADILERHPVAIAAEPFEPATSEPTRACSTCAHACRSGCCGEPVAAGLSDLPGVIRYHPDQGATCPAWLATIPGDLEARIRSMAERWGHSGDDLALVLDAARQDPEGWLRMSEVDDRGGPGNGE